MEEFFYKQAKEIKYTESMVGWSNIHKAVINHQSYEHKVFKSNLNRLIS